MSAPVYPMTDVAPTLAAILDIPTPAQSSGEPIAEIVADLSGAQGCAVVAPDALGMYPWGLWHQAMPFLESLIGRHHVVLQAVMPTITPVNFTTMITGADQSGHGIQTKDQDIGCETIFEVLAAHGKQGAAVGQEGCTMGDLIGRWAERCGQIARRAPRYEDDLVADTLLEVAAEATPEFLITQLVTTDDVFHQFKPSSAQVVPYLQAMDARLNRLVEGLAELDYAIIILSDHGQHDGDGGGTHGTDCDEDSLVPCTWTK